MESLIYIFAGTNNYGIIQSTDNGRNWTQVNEGMTNQMVCTFTFSGNNIFAGSEVDGCPS